MISVLFSSDFWHQTARAAGKSALSVPENECLKAGGSWLPPSTYLMPSLSETMYASQSLDICLALAMANSLKSWLPCAIEILEITPLIFTCMKPALAAHTLI